MGLTLFHLWLAGAGTFALCRQVGVGRCAATAAAIGVASCGTLPLKLVGGHIPPLYAFAWTPLALALTVRSVERGTRLPHPALVAVLAMQLLTGALQMTLYTYVCIGAIFLFYVVRPLHERPRIPLLVQGSLLVALTVGLTSFQLLPTARFILEAGRRAGLTYGVAGRVRPRDGDVSICVRHASRSVGGRSLRGYRASSGLRAAGVVVNETPSRIAAPGCTVGGDAPARLRASSTVLSVALCSVSAVPGPGQIVVLLVGGCRGAWCDRSRRGLTPGGGQPPPTEPGFTVAAVRLVGPDCDCRRHGRGGYWRFGRPRRHVFGHAALACRCFDGYDAGHRHSEPVLEASGNRRSRAGSGRPRRNGVHAADDHAELSSRRRCRATNCQPRAVTRAVDLREPRLGVRPAPGRHSDDRRLRCHPSDRVHTLPALGASRHPARSDDAPGWQTGLTGPPRPARLAQRDACPDLRTDRRRAHEPS